MGGVQSFRRMVKHTLPSRALLGWKIYQLSLMQHRPYFCHQAAFWRCIWIVITSRKFESKPSKIDAESNRPTPGLNNNPLWGSLLGKHKTYRYNLVFRSRLHSLHQSLEYLQVIEVNVFSPCFHRLSLYFVL